MPEVLGAGSQKRLISCPSRWCRSASIQSFGISVRSDAQAGVKDFVIATGYKGEAIGEYFSRFRLRQSDAIFDLAAGSVELMPRDDVPPWSIAVVDTGQATATGGRLKRLRGLAWRRVDFSHDLRRWRRQPGRATSRRIPPVPRQALHCNGGETSRALRNGRARRQRRGRVHGEVPAHEGWINGGFFVLERNVLDLIDGDSTAWEGAPMQRLARRGAAGRVSPRRLLAPDGHLARQTVLERTLGKRRGALENLVTSSPWSGRRVLVTGASGIVGSWLTQRLADEGAHVVAFVLDADHQSDFFFSGTVDRVSTVNGRLRSIGTSTRRLPA